MLAGSIPPPLTAKVYSDIIHEASEAGVHTVLDADGAALEAGAAALPEMVKGNRRELERLLGRHLDDETSTLTAAKEIQATGVPDVLVTRGREGAVAVDPAHSLSRDRAAGAGGQRGGLRRRAAGGRRADAEPGR